MPDFSDNLDAYASPADVKVSTPEGRLPRRLPTGLKVICIITLIMGGFGLLAALVSGVGLVAGEAMQTAMSQPNQPVMRGGEAVQAQQEMQKVQQEMQAEIYAISREYIIPQVAVAVLHAFSAGLLLLGAIMTLRRLGLGPGILTFAYLVSIVYVVMEQTLSVMIQLKSMPVYEKFSESMMGQVAEQSGGEAPNLPNFMMIAVAIGVAVYLAFSVAKIIFYLISTFYLRKSSVREIFRSESPVAKSF